MWVSRAKQSGIDANGPVHTGRHRAKAQRRSKPRDAAARRQLKACRGGLIVANESPEWFAKFLKVEYDKYGKLERDIGLQPQ
jgi:hypothetical protein